MPFTYVVALLTRLHALVKSRANRDQAGLRNTVQPPVLRALGEPPVHSLSPPRTHR
jgi:hypothetical protein